MSWVSIDKDKCKNCGICARRCLRCFTYVDKISAVNADETNCARCGHCVALCPNGAIFHSRLDMENFKPIGEPVRFDPDEFFGFVRQRRSHRHFRKDKVPRAEIEKLVDLCRYAPTGGNYQPVEIKVVLSADKIDKLSDLTIDYFMRLIEQVDNTAAAIEAEGKALPRSIANARERLSRYRLLRAAKEVGLDPIFYKAPAVMIFHANVDGTTPKDDCVIAAQTVTLAARTLGLESCYIGLFTGASKDNHDIADQLALKKGTEVMATLILGYPKLRFLRTVDRDPISVTWDL